MEKLHFHFAVYNVDALTNQDRSPKFRVSRLQDISTDEIGNDEILVTEVSEEMPNGKGLLIKEERIIKAPQVWLPIRFKPEYEGSYLCYLTRKNECGTESKIQQVVRFSYGKFLVAENETVTNWMLVSNPIQ